MVTMTITVSLDTFINMVYNSVYIPGLLLALSVGLITRYKYRISKPRFFAYFFTIVYGFLTAWLSGIIYTRILRAMRIEGQMTLAIFGAIVLTPLCIIATVLIEKGIRSIILKRSAGKAEAETGRQNEKTSLQPQYVVSIRNTMDMMTPIFIIVLIFVNFRCAWIGCCHGYPCSWGIYSHVAKTTTFPVQLFEAACTFIILMICYFIKQTSFFRRGMAFPMTAGLYCVSRFFWEFVRYYSPGERNFFLHMTFWQWLCIFVLLSSAVSVCILYKTQPSEPLPNRLRAKWRARRAQKPSKQTLTQKKIAKGWQSTKKKYKKK